MPPRNRLRVAEPDEKAATPARKLSVAEAAASGDHRSLLVAMRDRIATSISSADCAPRDLAALTRRLQDIAKEIEAIDLRAKEEALEDAGSANEEWDEAAL